MGLSTANILATIPTTALALVATVQQNLSRVAALRVRSEAGEGSRLKEIAAQFAATDISPKLTPAVAYTGFFSQAGTFMDDIEFVLGALRTPVGLKELRKLDPPSLRQLGYYFYELSVPIQPPQDADDGLPLDVYRRISRLNERGEVLGASKRCFDLASGVEVK